jgi:hypothetical protein
MRGKLTGYCVAALAIWAAGVTNGIADGAAFTRGCAARDMQVMMMLEASAMSQQERRNVVGTIMHARIVCFEGYVVDALALYDNIAQGISSEWALSAQARRPDDRLGWPGDSIP